MSYDSMVGGIRNRKAVSIWTPRKYNGAVREAAVSGLSIGEPAAGLAGVEPTVLGWAGKHRGMIAGCLTGRRSLASWLVSGCGTTTRLAGGQQQWVIMWRVGSPKSGPISRLLTLICIVAYINFHIHFGH